MENIKCVEGIASESMADGWTIVRGHRAPPDQWSKEIAELRKDAGQTGTKAQEM